MRFSEVDLGPVWTWIWTLDLVQDLTLDLVLEHASDPSISDLRYNTVIYSQTAV